MKKHIRFSKVDRRTRALYQATGLAVRFQFVPQMDPYRVIPLVHAFTDMVSEQGLGITGGTAEGKAWYFLGALPHTGHLTTQTRQNVIDWLATTPEIKNVKVGPIGETFYQAFGPSNSN